MPELGLWAVADGMGGHEAGDIASQMLIEGLQQIPPPCDWQDFLDSVRQQMQEVNQRLRLESAQRYQNRTIGSTVVALLIYETQCACLWVGTAVSTGYGTANSSNSPAITATYRNGRPGLDRTEDAHRHPLANVITRAVGSAEEMLIDEVIHPLHPGDMFLLCSDGLNKTVSDEEISRLLIHSDHDCHEAVKAFIHLALMRDASDNVTTVVVNIDADPLEAAEEPGATTVDNPIPPDWYLGEAWGVGARREAAQCRLAPRVQRPRRYRGSG